MLSNFFSDFRSELRPGKLAAKIVTAITIALLVIFWNNLSDWILKTYKSLSHTTRDKFYESLADETVDWAYQAYTITALIALAITVRYLQYVRYTYEKYLDRIEPKADATPSVERTSKTEEIQGTKEDIFKLKIFSGIVGLFFIIFIIYTSLQFSAVKLRKTFERKIKIAAPYIPQNSKEKLTSDFSLMKSEKEYDIISSRFDSIFKVNNLRP